MVKNVVPEMPSGGLYPEQLLTLSDEPWLLRREGFLGTPKSIQVNESLLTIGNGYLNIRGSLEELPPGHCGGMYLSGIYDKSEAAVEELVKCPMWTDVSIWSEGEKFCLSTCKSLRHEQVLDMQKGTLHRTTTVKNPSGKTITLETIRLVFMHNVHLGYLLVKITPRNFSGPIRVLSGLNGEVYNRGYFPREQLKHLQLERIERGRAFMYLEMKTREHGIHISEAASWKLVSPGLHSYNWEPRIYGEKFTSEITFDAHEGESYVFEKLAVVATSREIPAEEMFKGTISKLKYFVRSGAAAEIAAHLQVWQEKWKQADIVLNGDAKAQHALRFNIYQLLINAPVQPAGIGAKFLSSEGYLGHAFWDTEIFILPFYIYNFPEIARNMLLYRYNTLAGAKQNALKMGYRGAKYAWESATTGVDVTPRFASKLEKTIRLIYTGTEEDHIVSDVIYGVEKYYRVTADESFLLDYGLEMVFLTARFWASRVIREGENYEIRCVIGPDEFHEHVNNNTYTNFLVRWHLRLAVTTFRFMEQNNTSVLDELAARLELSKDEVDAWLDISRHIKILYDEETKLFEQFDGYFTLKDYVIEEHDLDGQPMLPRGVTDYNIQSTRLLKQADVISMMMLFPYAFSFEQKKANFDFYEQRTAHKSSLSHCIHAMVGLASGCRSMAYNYFMKTALFDLDNLHGNTALGIHAAAVGGTWQTVIHGFGGFSIKSEMLVLKPWMPIEWQSLSFSVRWKTRMVELTIYQEYVSVLIRSEEQISLPLSLYGKTYKLMTNQRYDLPEQRKKRRD
ncbi:MAG: glycoside hydrolase family 65 protein [Chlorobiaceae bacterium]|nr:glycoside hydrolase family 65 protein [Chlorobiaceae bacterium]